MLENYLLKMVHVQIDRPLGTRHPEHPALIYPVNYGFLPGTVSGDGEEIDAYVLGEFMPLTEFDGIVIAVIRRKNDKEDKLVVADRPGRYDRQQIAALLEFQERFFESEVIILEDWAG